MFINKLLCAVIKVVISFRVDHHSNSQYSTVHESAPRLELPDLNCPTFTISENNRGSCTPASYACVSIPVLYQGDVTVYGHDVS